MFCAERRILPQLLTSLTLGITSLLCGELDSSRLSQAFLYLIRKHQPQSTVRLPLMGRSTYLVSFFEKRID